MALNKLETLSSIICFSRFCLEGYFERRYVSILAYLNIIISWNFASISTIQM